MVGPLLGGVFTDDVTWRWCFYINLPIGAVSAGVIILVLHPPKKRQDPNATVEKKSIWQQVKELDLIGAALLLPAVVCLLLALQWGGNTYPWNNSRIIGLFVGSGVLIIIFAISQYYLGENATMPPRIIRKRSVIFSGLYAVCFGGAFFLLMYYLPIYFQSVRNASPVHSGIDLLPFLLATVISSMLGGGLVTAIGYYAPLLITGTAIFAIGSGFLTTYSIGMSNGRWIGYQILAGAGVGTGFQIPLTAVQTALHPDDIPIGSAIVIFSQNLGGALFIAVAQSVFQNGLLSALAQKAPSIDPSIILEAGATQLRTALQQIGQIDQLDAVVASYMSGLVNAYRVTLALCCAAFVAALGFEWRNVKHAQPGKEGGAPAVAAL